MKYSYHKSDNRRIFGYFLLGILIGLAISYSSYYYFSPVSQQPITITQTSPQITASYIAQINLAAVDQNGKGVTTPLTVEAKPGTGEALTNVDKLLFWVDTQYSIQLAKAVAENVTNINADKIDLTYSIETNATLVGGPSAGAALTIATISALENKPIKSDVMITGTINPDGTIGQVGGVLDKAKAAKDVGAKVFLVPEGQGEQITLKPNENCTRRANFIFCETTYEQVTVNIGKDVGISVIEVSNVTDAMKYFGL
jgi:uncharacterized protein